MINEMKYDDNNDTETSAMVSCDTSDSSDCCDEVADEDNETIADTDFYDNLDFSANTETFSGYSLQKIQILLCGS